MQKHFLVTPKKLFGHIYFCNCYCRSFSSLIGSLLKNTKPIAAFKRYPVANNNTEKATASGAVTPKIPKSRMQTSSLFPIPEKEIVSNSIIIIA